MPERTSAPLFNDVAGNSDKAATLRQRRIEQLKPHRFKPGQSGNPSGRPKNHLRELGQKVFADPKFQSNLYKALLKLNAPITKLVAEQTYGKPEQPVTGDKDKPIEINVNIRKIGN